MQKPPLLSGKINKNWAFEIVRPLRGEMWGYSMKSGHHDPHNFSGSRAIINYIHWGGGIDENRTLNERDKGYFELPQ